MMLQSEIQTKSVTAQNYQKYQFKCFKNLSSKTHAYCIVNKQLFCVLRGKTIIIYS